jgi:hypothetical protein
MPTTGRTAKAAPATKTGVLSLRIDPGIRSRLEAAAAENGRSLTQEIEDRLQRTFQADDSRQHVFAGFGSRQNFAVCRLIGDLMVHVSAAAGRSWISDAWTADQVRQGIDYLLRQLRPAGDSSPPEPRRYRADQVEQLGEMTAAGQLLYLDVTDSTATPTAKPGEVGYGYEAIKADLGELLRRGGAQ